MNVYICTNFYGNVSIGTSAVIVAKDRYQAKALLEQKLKKLGLDQNIEPESMTILDTDKAKAYILSGTY